MEQLARGQKKKLSDLTAATHLDVGVSVPALGSRVLDVSCFGLDDPGPPRTIATSFFTTRRAPRAAP